MRILFLLIFLGLPFFAALGHDVHLMKEKTGSYEFNKEEFVFSDLGWIWVKYDESSYNRKRKQWPDEWWEKYLDPLLSQDAVVVGGALSLLLYVIFIPLALIGGSSNDPRRRRGGKNDDPYAFKSARGDLFNED